MIKSFFSVIVTGAIGLTLVPHAMEAKAQIPGQIAGGNPATKDKPGTRPGGPWPGGTPPQQPPRPKPGIPKPKPAPKPGQPKPATPKPVKPKHS
jgi:hypothetical protein